MMLGWAAPGKPAFQAEAEASMAAQQAASQDSATVQDSPAAEDSATAQGSAPSAQDPADTGDSTVGTRASNSLNSTSQSDDGSGVGQAIQNMTRMFEQRRQIQAQQNQPPAAPPK